MMNQSVLPTIPPLGQLMNPDSVCEFANCLGDILALQQGPRPVESISCDVIFGKVLSPFSSFERR